MVRVRVRVRVGALGVRFVMGYRVCQTQAGLGPDNRPPLHPCFIMPSAKDTCMDASWPGSG